MIANYLYWQFIASPKKLLFVVKKTVIYLYYQFSIKYLLKTLLEPWKKDIVQLANPSLQERFTIFTTNLVSRFMGFLVRSITVLAGSIIIVLIIMLSIVIFVIWVFLPIIAIYMIYKGIVT